MSNGTHVEKGPIVPALLSFALPVLILQLMQEMYNITVCMIVGHFGGEHALAAIGVAGLVLSILINFFVGFSSGISVVTSRLFGAYDYPELNRTLNAVIRMVILTGLCLTGLSLVGTDVVFALLQSPSVVRPGAAAYFRICACGLAAQMIYNVGAAFLRSIGDTKTPLLFYTISIFCNLVLDVALVAILRKGIVGAAVATLCAQWLLAGMILVYLMCLKGDFSLRLLGVGLSLKEIGHILSIGLPAGMQALFMSISSLLIQVNINSFGPNAIAGMTLFAKLEGFLYLPAFAYGIALTSFVGQNLGAKQIERIKSAVRLSVCTMVGLILPLSLILSLASPWLLKLFTRDEAILFNAHEAVVYTLPFYVIYAVNQVYLGTIKGLGNTAYPMFCTLICYALFRVVWCRALIPAFPTMHIVYLSYVVSFFLLLVLLLPKYRGTIKRYSLDIRKSSEKSL